MKYCYSFRCEVRTTTSKYSIVRDQVVLGRFYLSDNSHASVVKQPNHRAFGLGRIPISALGQKLFRHLSKTFSTKGEK